MFERGVSCRSSLGCYFSVLEAKRNVLGNTGHVPLETPFLKLLFRTTESAPSTTKYLQYKIYVFGKNGSESPGSAGLAERELPKNTFRNSEFCMKLTKKKYKTNSRKGFTCSNFGADGIQEAEKLPKTIASQEAKL